MSSLPIAAAALRGSRGDFNTGERAMARSIAVAGVGFAIAISLSATLADDTPKNTPPTAVPLAVGAALPEFTCLDDGGQEWKSNQHVGNKVLVIYFYPGDFTSGCTKQAQAFRDGLTRLEELGVELVGVSGDEVATHKLFKETHSLRHTLLADPDGVLADQLGIPVQRPAKPIKVRTRGPDGKPLLDNQGKSLFIERKITLPRWTLIISRDGHLVSKRTTIDPATDATEVALLLQTLSP